MDIKTKFNVGDSVYQVEKSVSRNTKECSVCKGVGKISLDGEEFNCPKCYGNGSYGEAINITGKKCTIVGISIEVRDEVSVFYTLNSSRFVKEEDLFSTEEEAQKRCDILNKKYGNSGFSRK